MAQVGELIITGDPASDITQARSGQHWALRVNSSNEGGTGKLPVTRCGSAADADEVVGQYVRWSSSDAVDVRIRGILELRTTVTYATSMNGQGVQAVGTGANQLGTVENSGTLGDGFGKIIGSRTIGSGASAYTVLRVLVV